MTDLIFPPSARISRSRCDLVSNTAVERSIFTGAVRSVARAGDRWRLGLSTENASDRETYAVRAALKAARAASRGQANRWWLTDPAYVRRGNFPTSELLTNNTFANGMTGWGAQSPITATVADRVYRATRNEVTSAVSVLSPSAGATVTQYAPYAARVMAVRGRWISPAGVGIGIGATQHSQDIASSTAGDFRLIATVAVPAVTTMFPSVIDHNVSGLVAGDYFEIPYVSLSRCALIDNGPNALLQSDDFTDAAWVNTRTTDAANTSVAPDGTATGDNIIEDASASTTHYIGQDVTVGSAALDYCFAVALQANSRSFARVVLREGTGGHECFVDVNLLNGALGTPGVIGANWANPRAFPVALGNGWYYVAIVGQKTNAATTVTPIIYLATALGTISYTGDGASNIRAWRATLAQSSVPTRLVQTTTAATTGASPTGSAMNVKGLPVSTAGLLLPGDLVAVLNSGLHRVIAPLNSDAAGLGYLQFEPNLRKSNLADNTPVIIHNPMGRFVLTDNVGGWDDRPGGLSEFEFMFEESLDA